MPAFSRATSVAAVALVAVVGAGSLYYLISNRPDDQPGVPTAQPSQTALPSQPNQPSPTATPPPPPDGPAAAGSYRLRPSMSSSVTVDVTIPGGGWLGGPPNTFGGPVGESNGPNGLAIAFLMPETIHSDPCHWDHAGTGAAPQDGDVAPGPTVDDLVEALAASTTYTSTTPVDVTIGGFSGKQLELQLTPDPEGCDTFAGDVNQFFVFGGREGLFSQGFANTWQVTILDVNGSRVVGVVFWYEDTSPADITAAEAILESAVINP